MIEHVYLQVVELLSAKFKEVHSTNTVCIELGYVLREAFIQAWREEGER